MAITARDYGGETDLRLMQALQQELWSLEGPRVHAHPGDLAWWVSMHVGREREWKRRLWLDGDRCVAWAWLDLPASLDHEVHRDHRGAGVHEEVLDWFEAEAEEGDSPLQAWHMEGDDLSLALLRGRGYEQPEHPRSYLYFVRKLGEEEPPPLPAGYSLRTVRGDGDLAARVRVHQVVWAPSRVTEESYANVMRTWPYRLDLDCVVEVPDGELVAYVLCWYDERNRVGEFEPVGTHPDHRRLGLGAGVCRYALRRLREEGARHAIVYASGGDDGVAAAALYASVGFTRHTRMLELRKERA